LARNNHQDSGRVTKGPCHNLRQRQKRLALNKQLKRRSAFPKQKQTEYSLVSKISKKTLRRGKREYLSEKSLGNFAGEMNGRSSEGRVWVKQETA